MDQSLRLGLLRRVQQALLVWLTATWLANQTIRALGRKALADIDHPGSAQPDLPGNRPIGQATLAEPDRLPPALFLSGSLRMSTCLMPMNLRLLQLRSRQ